jgi:hypothetical protein
MDVRVDQARDDPASGEIDAVRASRERFAPVREYIADATVLDHERGGSAGGGSGAVDDRRADERLHVGRYRGPLTRDRAAASRTRIGNDGEFQGPSGSPPRVGAHRGGRAGTRAATVAEHNRIATDLVTAFNAHRAVEGDAPRASVIEREDERTSTERSHG